MATQMYVNLPVKDLDRSVDFFTRLGFGFNPQFTDGNATRQTEVLICLSCDSREQVSDMVGQAIASGGTTPHPPQDHGFMYQHGFQDLDGHLWELMYVDAVAISPSDSALS